MKRHELELIVQKIQKDLGDPEFEAIVINDMPGAFTIMIGGVMDELMYTYHDSTWHEEIKTLPFGETERDKYIHHISMVVRKAKIKLRHEIIRKQLSADEQ